MNKFIFINIADLYLRLNQKMNFCAEIFQGFSHHRSSPPELFLGKGVLKIYAANLQ